MNRILITGATGLVGRKIVPQLLVRFWQESSPQRGNRGLLIPLKEHRRRLDEDKHNFGAEYQDHGLIFCQPNGYYYSPNNVGLGVKELLTKAGLKEL